MEDVRQKIESIEGVKSAVVNLVFEPEWDKDMMSEEGEAGAGLSSETDGLGFMCA